MEKEELDITLCVFDPAKPGPYEQYILPHFAAEMRREPERFAALGAAWKDYAVGAAVLTDDTDDPNAAALVSLFVDPLARSRGVGTALLAASVKIIAEVGVEEADALLHPRRGRAGRDGPCRSRIGWGDGIPFPGLYHRQRRFS